MPQMQVFNSFKEAIAEGLHDLGADTLKVVLTNTAPTLSNAVLADISEIAAGFGYTAGGVTATVTSSSQTGGTYSLVIDAVTFTAAGGDIGPFQWFVLYNDTAPADELIAFGNYGAPYTLGDTLSFTINAGTWLQNA